MVDSIPGTRIALKKEKLMVKNRSARPWWLYFLYAGTDVLGRVLTTAFPPDGRDGLESITGIRVHRGEDLKPGIDPERITATTIIGERVIGSDGNELGKIEEVALDLTTGAVSYLVMSAGGVFGFGDRFYALPLGALTISPGEKTFHLEIDKKQLKRLPGFNKQDWPKKAHWPITR
jgi:sporulation protein YlmC with PRC-barrel domain